MDLMKGNVKTIYFRYLAAAFGSAMISSIYAIVDMAMVGQYQGPSGTAALAVVAPIWNIVYSLGLLTGIGGSVLFSTARGQGEGKKQQEYFSVAFYATLFLALLSWIIILFFETPMLRLFGADQALLPLSKEYLFPIKFTIPAYPFSQMFAAFLRNDGHPGLATAAVLSGGILNIVGDYLFVFVLDMGIMGAGLATAIGAVVTVIVMLAHFFTKKNTLRLILPHRLFYRLGQILIIGFPTFLIDVAMGGLTMLFNRQIMAYLGTSALAVYGVIVNLSTMVQCSSYSVGQAAQPLISLGFGSGAWNRIRQTLRYSLYTAALFGLIWTLLLFLFPHQLIRIFMVPTPEVSAIGPAILRSYGLSFLLLPLNVFSTYYFQSLMKPGASFAVSAVRGIVLSGILIYLLPLWFPPHTLWFAMPITEAVTAVVVMILILRFTKALPQKAKP